MDLYLLIGLFWIGVSVVWGLVARRKGRSFLAIFALSIFVTPIIGMIVALLLQPTDAAKMSLAAGGSVGSVGPVPCPYCKEQIRADAIVCKHCGKDVEPAVDRMLAERQEKVEREEMLRLERNRRLELAEQARTERFASWRKKPSVKWTFIALVVLIVAGVAAPFIVDAISRTSEAQRTEAAKAEAQALLVELDQWGAVVESCGEPPAGVTNLKLLSDKTLNFTLADIESTTPAAFAFLDCLGNGLGYVDLDVTTGSAQIAPLNTPLSAQVANEIRHLGPDSATKDNGYNIVFSGSCPTEYTCAGAFDITITKNETFGIRAKN